MRLLGEKSSHLCPPCRQTWQLQEIPAQAAWASYLHRYASKGIWVLGTKMQGATRNSTVSLYSTVSGTS